MIIIIAAKKAADLNMANAWNSTLFSKFCANSVVPLISPILIADNIQVLPKNSIAPYRMYNILFFAVDSFSSSFAFNTKVMPFRIRNINSTAHHRTLITSRNKPPLELAQPGNAIGFG